MRPETEAAANQTATKLEDATKQHNVSDFHNALEEVNVYLKTNPTESIDLKAKVAERLTADHLLGSVSLFEVKGNFGMIDLTGDHIVSKAEIGAYQRSIDNSLEKDLLGSAADKIAKFKPEYGPDGISEGATESHIDTELKKTAEKNERRSELEHLFERTSGANLYERLVDEKGNIPGQGISKLLTSDHTLTDADKKTLTLLNEHRNKMPFTNDFSDSRLKELCTRNGAAFGTQLKTDSTATLSANDSELLTKQPASVDTTLNRTQDLESSVKDNVAQPTAATKGNSSDRTVESPDSEKPSPPQNTKAADGTVTKSTTESANTSQTNLEAAATIKKRGESYAHCAERLLAAFGVKDPGASQLRHLSHLLWVANGCKKAGALSVHERLKLDDKVMRELQGSVKPS